MPACPGRPFCCARFLEVKLCSRCCAVIGAAPAVVFFLRPRRVRAPSAPVRRTISLPSHLSAAQDPLYRPLAQPPWNDAHAARVGGASPIRERTNPHSRAVGWSGSCCCPRSLHIPSIEPWGPCSMCLIGLCALRLSRAAVPLNGVLAARPLPPMMHLLFSSPSLRPSGIAIRHACFASAPRHVHVVVYMFSASRSRFQIVTSYSQWAQSTIGRGINLSV